MAALSGLLWPSAAWAGGATRPAPDNDALRPCKDVGPGYFRIAGTSTCMMLRVDMKNDHRRRSSRKELLIEPDRDETGPRLFYHVGRLAPDRPIGRTLSEVKAFVNTATETEYGTLATSVGWKAQIESPPRRPSDPFDPFNRTGERTLLERASIRLGGLSAGFMPSFFDFPTASLSYTTAYASETNTSLVAYTRRLFGSIDGTISLEDGSARRVVDRAWGEYAGQRAPDVVAALNGNFDWGSIHVAAAIHPVRAFAPTGCCGEGGRAMGFAATAGIEHWFDLGAGMSGDILLAAAATRGGLDYLNASNYPAALAVSRTGRVYLTEGGSFVASYLHKWTNEVRTVVTASKFRTRLDTETFELRTEGLLLQAALDYMPVRGLSTGIELNLYRDRARGSDAGVAAPPAANRYTTGVLYMRRRF